MKHIDFSLLSILFIGWLGCSIMASIIKVDRENCNRSYPIGYILNTNLFCETK